MAKKYEFIIRLIKATYRDGNVQVLISDMFPGNELREFSFEGTLSEAIRRRAEISAAEPRSHAAFLEMMDRKAKKPPGFKGVKVLYGGEGSK